MRCGLCGRTTRGERLPRGWKVCGLLVFCPQCRRLRFRLRSLTMSVAEPVRARWDEFCAALEKVYKRASPLLLNDKAWELTTVKGRHILRVLIGNQWWALRLDDTGWSRSRSEIYQRIASGEVATGEFLLYRRPAYQGRSRNRPAGSLHPYEIECKTVAWLPREQQENPAKPRNGLHPCSYTPLPPAYTGNVEEMDISILRRAIRANRVSFPSQIPTFPGCPLPEMQPKLVQLYFVMGWSRAKIAARYGLPAYRVESVLNSWKSRAAHAGYIQHISPVPPPPPYTANPPPNNTLPRATRFTETIA
jgi:hypothetical protein